jgi:purine-binding chemotaxis protein CheW
METQHAAIAVDQQVVVFRLEHTSYAVDIAAVSEIVRPQVLTEVPHPPPCVLGVINLRGSIIPVIDLRQRCGLPSVEQTRDTRIVVVQSEGRSVGLQVDAVSEVIVLPAEAIVSAVGLVRGAESANLLQGVARLEERLILLLDLTEVVDTTVELVAPSEAELAALGV